MESNPICWFEIYVQDMTRAKAFYERVFDVKLSKLESPNGPEMWSFPGNMERYGTPGALVRMPGVSSGGSGTVVYFSCEDCATEQSRVEAAGGKIEKPKFSIGQYGSIALVKDSEGNMIGLHSQK